MVEKQLKFLLKSSQFYLFSPTSHSHPQTVDSSKKKTFVAGKKLKLKKPQEEPQKRDPSSRMDGHVDM